MSDGGGSSSNYPIIDSHIHLYADTHIPHLNWAPSLPDGHVLKRQNSVEQYRAATKSRSSLLGFVFVETDRRSGLEEDSWEHALAEVDLLRRIRDGSPSEGEGHVPEDRSLALGVVAWAPLGASVKSLEKYLDRLGASRDLQAKDGLVRGFRYLLQDKPQGTALRTEFIDGLLLLEKQGAKSFDLGVDYRQGGQWQLLEAAEMLRRFYEHSTGTMKIVINHLCKPNLHENVTTPRSDPENFKVWRKCIKTLSEFPTTYMKLSGLFSELPSQSPDQPTPISELLDVSRPYIQEIFRDFGPDYGNSGGKMRIMFGSDWPVCNVGGPGIERSWTHWVDFVGAVLEELHLSHEDKAMVWAGCAKEVYGLDVRVDR
ncbi:L-rhamnono-gamma-lactonase [Lithohypha guttulata]|nr:L-rhamnono-gamma-lactonase [Lithohypha guttulata]